MRRYDASNCPARYRFPRGEKEVRHYDLRLLWQWPVPVARSLTLDVYPADTLTQAYLAHNSVSFSFTDSDLGPVGSNLPITKVVYLRDDPFRPMSGSPLVEMIVSTRLEPGIDPLEEADKRGTIIAVLHLSRIHGGPVDWTEVKNPNGTSSSVKPGTTDVAGDKTGRPAVKPDDASVTKGLPGMSLGDSAVQAPLPSYKEVATSLLQVPRRIGSGKSSTRSFGKTLEQQSHFEGRVL